MKMLMLGSGTSTGVPRIGDDWGDCDPKEPRNRRTRVSILVEGDQGEKLLVDTSTDLRQQLLENGISSLDGVFWTHDHADHCHGIDDLRVLRYGRGGPIPAFASKVTAQSLRRRFSYVFAGEYGYPTICALDTLEKLRIFAGFGVTWCQMPHGPTETTGFRFEYSGKSVVYATDFSEISADMIDCFENCDLLVTDCLRRDPHPTHAHLAMALELGARTSAAKIVLSHLDKSMDYASLQTEVPSNVIVGYDGLEITL